MDRPEKGFKANEELWDEACNVLLYVKLLHQWHFGWKRVAVGLTTYVLNTSTLYELTLSGIHAQYWECTGPMYLRSYHHSLQWQVEQGLQLELTTQSSLPELHPWLMMVMFMKTHDAKGRNDMKEILNEIEGKDVIRLKSATYNEQGIPFLYFPC